jgi:hypothetical protein
MAVLNDVYYESDLVLPSGLTPMAARAKPAVEAATVSGTANDSATGPAGTRVSAYLTGSRRRYGVHARYLSLVRVAGTGATAYRIHDRLPILTKSLWDASTTSSVVVYAGFTWEIVDKVAEFAL